MGWESTTGNASLGLVCDPDLMADVWVAVVTQALATGIADLFSFVTMVTIVRDVPHLLQGGQVWLIIYVKG